MNFGAAIGNIFKIAVAGGCIYGVVMWQSDRAGHDAVGAFAEKACVDEIRARFDASRVAAYSLKKNENGYVVRATLTLNKGNTAKAYCLTNTHGGVKDISLEER